MNQKQLISLNQHICYGFGVGVKAEGHWLCKPQTVHAD